MLNKMIFIMNALENGWKIRKVKQKVDKYIFYKKLVDGTDINSETFLNSFISDSLSTDLLN
jgi:hypothetical protein